MTSSELSFLVVDDQKDITDMLDAHLSKFYKVICFNDPLEALKNYENNPTYSIILVDYYMPNLRGDEFMDRVLTINPKQQIIAIIGSPRLSFLNIIKKYSSVVQIIEKPFQLSELDQAIKIATNS
ncbi:MAG: hypothetical protein COA79_08240 [Planctomycetota bacterium]|nr:MAG: hypothetical protein COA79_08240 [Planctomycetota bacterium]